MLNKILRLFSFFFCKFDDEPIITAIRLLNESFWIISDRDSLSRHEKWLCRQPGLHYAMFTVFGCDISSFRPGTSGFQQNHFLGFLVVFPLWFVLTWPYLRLFSWWLRGSVVRYWQVLDQCPDISHEL
jgi:hypothetical protein